MEFTRTHPPPEDQLRSSSCPRLTPQVPGSDANTPARALTVPYRPSPPISLQKAIGVLYLGCAPAAHSLLNQPRRTLGRKGPQPVATFPPPSEPSPLHEWQSP